MELYEDVIHTLDEAACWKFLETHKLGRLGYILLDEPHIVPINYVARDGRIYFRTGEGSKLFGVTVHSRVAFEVDEWVGRNAASVLLHGTVTELDGDTADAVDDAIQSWIETPKTHVLMLEPTEITGRRFELAEAH